MSTPETSASPLPVLQQPLDEIVREMGFTKLCLAMTLSCFYLRVTASQSLSVSPLILTCSGKLWPIIAAAAGALELQNKLELASFVVLRMRYCAYDVILRRFRIPSPPKPGGALNKTLCVSEPDSFSPRKRVWLRETTAGARARAHVNVYVHRLVYTHAVNVHVYVCAQLHSLFF